MNPHQTLLSIAPHYAGLPEFIGALIACVISGAVAFTCLYPGPFVGARLKSLAIAMGCVLAVTWLGYWTGRTIFVVGYVADAEYVLKTNFTVSNTRNIDLMTGREFHDAFDVTGGRHHPEEVKTVLGQAVFVPGYFDDDKTFMIFSDDAMILQKALLASSDPGNAEAARRMVSLR